MMVNFLVILGFLEFNRELDSRVLDWAVRLEVLGFVPLILGEFVKD